jgi:pimeloyl-ACP methyl ester carboxylesterase
MQTIDLPMSAGVVRGVTPCTLRGERPLILLLHGGHGSWRHWRANLDGLAGFVDPLAIDLPGYGDSDDAPEGLTLSGYAQLVDEALRSLPPVAVVAGFSFGTLVATELARLWQERATGFRGVMLINPPLGAEVSPEVLKILEEGVRQTRRGGLSAGVEVTQRRIMIADPSRVTEELIADAAEQVRRSRFKSRPLSRTIDIREQIRGLSCPVHLLLGGQDPHQRAALTDRLAQYRDLVGSARVHLVPQAAHWLAFEYPGVVIDVVGRLLDETPVDPPARLATGKLSHL